MGLYDDLKIKYPLPDHKEFQEAEFQTKSTPSQFLDNYEIRKDGTLWHEAYDIEDRSDPSAEGFERWVGCMTRANFRWEQVTDFTGEIRFYCFEQGRDFDIWVEYSSYFLKGQLRELHLIKYEEREGNEDGETDGPTAGERDEEGGESVGQGEE